MTSLLSLVSESGRTQVALYLACWHVLVESPHDCKPLGAERCALGRCQSARARRLGLRGRRHPEADAREVHHDLAERRLAAPDGDLVDRRRHELAGDRDRRRSRPASRARARRPARPLGSCGSTPRRCRRRRASRAIASASAGVTSRRSPCPIASTRADPGGDARELRQHRLSACGATRRNQTGW